MPRTVLITAATGTVGRLLVRRLADAGVRPRALVRDAENDRAHLGEDVDIVVGDLSDRTAVRNALAGVDALFLGMNPIATRTHRRGEDATDPSTRIGRTVLIAAISRNNGR